MDNNHNKAWLWRKKSAEKNVVASEKALRGIEDEVQALQAEKVELEKDLKTLEDKLSSALTECTAKDELVKKHSRMADESIKGWDKAEEEAAALKLLLDEALQQRLAGEERLSHLVSALEECKRQLGFVREEQEQRIHDAVMKTSVEFEKARMMLEEKLVEANKRLSKIVTDNAHLEKGLVLKEKLIEELTRQLNLVEADFGALMTRMEATEKDNSSFKYEVRVLEKELEIRNEEREFNRRIAEASHRQHLDYVKKIAKMESECQRLRLLVRKRLPGPADWAKMKNEVEMLGRDSDDIRRKSNPTSLMLGSMGDNSSETPIKREGMLTEQLFTMEEENKVLREELVRMTNELESTKNIYACTASKLSQVELQFDSSSKGIMSDKPARNSLMSHELSLESASEIGSDDKASCAESWASALISELENLRNEKQKGSILKGSIGASDINLMDDFVEMEKLAVVSVDKPDGGSHVSSDEAIQIAVPIENEYSSGRTETEIVPLSDSESRFSIGSSHGIKSSVTCKFPIWLQDTLKLVLEENRVTGRSFQEILEETRLALDHITCSRPGEHVDAVESLNQCDVNISQSINSNHQIPPDRSKSIHKMIELIEGLGLPSSNYDNPEKFSKKEGKHSCSDSQTPEGYIARVLQWKTSELTAVLQQYVVACYDLLNGKAVLDQFVQQVTVAMEWIINHCFSLQDVSSMRDAIIKQCHWDDCDSELEVGIMRCSSGTDVPREHASHLSSVSASNSHSIHTENTSLTKVDGQGKSKHEVMDSEKKESTKMNDDLKKKLQESEKVIETLRTELCALRNERVAIEHLIEHQKMMNEDLDTQLTVTRRELIETRQQFSSVEVELENKSHCFEELEATCVELELQLESMKKESPNASLDQKEKQLPTDREITEASEKLAVCQETILNLGKQLKALSTPRGGALLDKVISTPNDAKTIAEITRPALKEGKSMKRRTSLLNQMLADDVTRTRNPKSPETREIDCKMGSSGTIEPLEKILVLGSKNMDGDNDVVETTALAPTKKSSGVSLWKKLLWRKKKGYSKKASLSP